MDCSIKVCLHNYIILLNLQLIKPPRLIYAHFRTFLISLLIHRRRGLGKFKDLFGHYHSWSCGRPDSAGRQTIERKPHIANTMAINFKPCILSWKKTTARTGTIGKPAIPTALEKREDVSKISPAEPIAYSCQHIAVQTRVMI